MGRGHDGLANVFMTIGLYYAYICGIFNSIEAGAADNLDKCSELGIAEGILSRK
jgi:hypothetical protein